MKKIAIAFHKLIFPILMLMFKSINAHKIVHYNEMPKINGNVIFAVNHSCKYDVPYTCQAIKRHTYLLAGQQTLELVDRIAFHLLGTVWVDRKSKEDKKKSVSKMVALLNNGANLIMFPEGTWNLTPSKPMLPLYWGIIDISRSTQKPIVPIVLEYTKDKCYVAFGDPISISQKDDKGKKINDLADVFATLKWSIWEKYDDTGYDTLNDWENEVKRRLEEYPKLDIEYETSVIRKV